MWSVLRKRLTEDKFSNEERQREKETEPDIDIDSLDFRFEIRDIFIYMDGDLRMWPSVTSDDHCEQIYKYIESLIDKKGTLVRSGRHVLTFGGDVTSQGLSNQEVLPNFITKIISNGLQEMYQTDEHQASSHWNPDGRQSGPDINHVIINKYERGTGIHLHNDGPAYHPYVLILSLGSGCVFQFQNQSGTSDMAIHVPKDSVIRFSGKAYSNMLHGIEPGSQNQETVATCVNYRDCSSDDIGLPRISLTFRYVRPTVDAL